MAPAEQPPERSNRFKPFDLLREVYFSTFVFFYEYDEDSWGYASAPALAGAIALALLEMIDVASILKLIGAMKTNWIDYRIVSVVALLGFTAMNLVLFLKDSRGPEFLQNHRHHRGSKRRRLYYIAIANMAFSAALGLVAASS